MCVCVCDISNLRVKRNKTRSLFSRELNFDRAKVEIKQMYDNTACISNFQCRYQPPLTTNLLSALASSSCTLCQRQLNCQTVGVSTLLECRKRRSTTSHFSKYV